MSGSLTAMVAEMMRSAWREPGFCVPNADTYPFQWLWDSCFHCLIWNKLGSDRAVIELDSVFARQHESGFVPHMTYWADPDFASSFWGRSHTSAITQPPMYGHVIAELERSGTRLPKELFEQAARGLFHLVSDRPRTAHGLIPIFHPWESGCDDSARWDSWRDIGPTKAGASDGELLGSGQVPNEIESWRARKGEFVQSLQFDSSGAPVANPEFAVGSVGFNALVSWNIRELLAAAANRSDLPSDLTVRLATLREGNDELVRAVRQRWSVELSTWVDDGPASGKSRTADALLCLLVDPRPEAFPQLVDPEAFGGAFGTRGAHKSDRTYDPGTYWRGGTWPQLTYMLNIAALSYSDDLGTEVGRRFVAGATESGLAEYWHPETGRGLGAIPQTWTGLALLCQDH